MFDRVKTEEGVMADVITPSSVFVRGCKLCFKKLKALLSSDQGFLVCVAYA